MTLLLALYQLKCRYLYTRRKKYPGGNTEEEDGGDNEIKQEIALNGKRSFAGQTVRAIGGQGGVMA